MPWTELTDLRNQRSKTYQDDTNPLKRAWSGALAALHYESHMDSGIYDAEINMTPQRINNPQFDGWRITASSWHYALGKDLAHHGQQDGWVGFGGRQGAHWFKFRLARVGYLHWPTRAWDDIGGPPNYDRTNLSQLSHSITIGPNNDPINVHTIATWRNLWNTPGGGQLQVSWRANGDRLKELITINQAGREWIQANRPPSTPANETHFGFVFQLDWSDIPKCLHAGILQDVDDDFADDGEPIELHDALDRLLAFMPVSDVIVPSSGPLPASHRQPLRKRFWKDTDGNHYLLLGIRCDMLAGMPAGDLVFDPTVDVQVGAGANDGERATGTDGFNASANFCIAGYNSDAAYLHVHTFQRWTGVTISGTITASYVQIYASNAGVNTPELKVYGVDEDNPAAPTSAAEFDADPLTTAGVDWDGAWSVTAWAQSPSLNTIFQELADTYTISNDAVMIQIKNDGGTTVRYNYPDHYELNASNAAKLHIEYTVAGGDAMPMASHHYRMRRA